MNLKPGGGAGVVSVTPMNATLIALLPCLDGTSMITKGRGDMKSGDSLKVFAETNRSSSGSVFVRRANPDLPSTPEK